ncbi:MAG: methyltransferase domain-containing protein [Nitrospirae bacterium]|nr:methyltransferase domain-containing protein [Nitrospirota bacterium]
MLRYDVRCNARIPATILSDYSSGNVHQHTEIKNLGLNGAFLNSLSHLTENELIRLKAHLPNIGDFEIDGMILRKDEDGFAVRFINLDKSSRLNLWEYIKDNLSSEKTCPYCGSRNIDKTENCWNCGRNVNFGSKKFLDIHERELQQRWIDYIENATEELIERFQVLEEAIHSQSVDSDKIPEILKQISDDFLFKAERFESEIKDISVIKHYRADFHQKTNHIFSKGYLYNRARTWPQGYHGDYKTLETAYRNIPLSDGIGHYLDLAALDSTLAVAVRNRIIKLQNILKDELINRSGPAILNIACGSCRELVEIAPEILKSKAQILCVDNDEDALSFSYSRLYHTGALPHIEFRKHNALRMFDYELTLKDFGTRDIIYSAGFFDYLPSDFLVKMFKTFYKLLNPGGKLIAPFKDVRRYRPQDYHWLTDWDGFLQRKEEDFREIIKQAGIPESAITESREESGVIIFYVIEAF